MKQKIKILGIILLFFFVVLGNCKHSKKNNLWWLLLLLNGNSGFLTNNGTESGGGDSGVSLFNPAIGEIDDTFGSNSNNGNNNDANEPNQYMSAYNFGTTIDKMDMVLQGNKIILVGTTCIDRNNNSSCDASTELDVIIARFNEDGSIDTTFDSDGIKIINVSYHLEGVNKKDRGYSVTLDHNNNIFIVVDAVDSSKIAIIKLLPNGE